MTSPEPLDLFSSEPELPEQIVSLAEKVAKEATILRDLVRAHTEQVEHTADETVHLRLFGLDHTSFSECDREDLQKLAFCLDEILKSVCGAQDCVLLYNLSDAPPFAGELTRLLHRQAEELRAAISLLQRREHVFQHCAIIKQLESDADRIINSVLTELSKHEIDATRLSNLTELLVQLGLATEVPKMPPKQSKPSF